MAPNFIIWKTDHFNFFYLHFIVPDRVRGSRWRYQCACQLDAHYYLNFELFGKNRVGSRTLANKSWIGRPFLYRIRRQSVNSAKNFLWKEANKRIALSKWCLSSTTELLGLLTSSILRIQYSDIVNYRRNIRDHWGYWKCIRSIKFRDRPDYYSQAIRKNTTLYFYSILAFVKREIRGSGAKNVRILH